MDHAVVWKKVEQVARKGKKKHDKRWIWSEKKMRRLEIATSAVIRCDDAALFSFPAIYTKLFISALQPVFLFHIFSTKKLWIVCKTNGLIQNNWIHRWANLRPENLSVTRLCFPWLEVASSSLFSPTLLSQVPCILKFPLSELFWGAFERKPYWQARNTWTSSDNERPSFLFSFNKLFFFNIPKSCGWGLPSVVSEDQRFDTHETSLEDRRSSRYSSFADFSKFNQSMLNNQWSPANEYIDRYARYYE